MVFVSRTVGMTPEPFEHQLVHQMFNARLLVSNRLSLLFPARCSGNICAEQAR